MTTLRKASAFALVAALGGCSDGRGAPREGSDAPCPTTLHELATQVFQPSCIDSGCHGTEDPAANLDLEGSALGL